MRWLPAAMVIGVLAAAAPAQAQTPTPGPVAAVCPALFHVLHSDHVGDLVLNEGRYRITTFGEGAPNCFQSSDLLRQFLEDWDGRRLPRPWVVDAQLPGFTQGSGGTTGFQLAPATPTVPDTGGGGRHPASGDDCPGFFHVLHDDYIGQSEVDAGWYRITVLAVGRLTCSRAATLFAEFLQDFGGRLQDGWQLDPVTGTFSQNSSLHLAFRVKEVAPGETRNDDRGTHPENGANRCPATFRVRNNDRIGALRLRAGNYRITSYGRISCAAASSLLADFLQAGSVPRAWSIDTGEGSFWQGRGRRNGFRLKPVRFRG
jgi:hypothetical protein